MTEQKKPEPGQWLIANDDDTKVFLIGKNSEGQWVIEWEDGTSSVDSGLEDWHHEPDCTGWTWQPQDWVTQDRVPARPGIDQYRWEQWNEDEFVPIGKFNRVQQFRHGEVDPQDGKRIFLRCLRKDLPPVQETWPKYYETTVPGELAFLRRDTATAATYVLTDGKEDGAIVWGCADEWRKELTESEALARVVKPEEPDLMKPDRWFIWNDNRYPIAFVCHADGTCENLNVEFVFKPSDKWNSRWDKQVKTGELKEVTAKEAITHLKQRWPATAEPQPTPLRMFATVDGVLYCDTQPRTPMHNQVRVSSCGCFVVEVGE